jgi:hypothetical protein
MVILFFIQFSIPLQGSFTPYCFNVVFFNPSFYCPEQPKKIDTLVTKKKFSPIIFAVPNPKEEKMMEEISLETKITKKENLNEKCETEDEEYTPGSSQQRKQKKNQQNENRNIMPNIVNQILSFIQKKNKSMGTTEKIFAKYNARSEWSVKRFYLYQNMLKNKISHYVNEETMKIFMRTGNVDYLVYSL